MNQKQIEEVNSHKHLGVVLSDDCTWHDHLDYIKCKAWNRANVMPKLKFKLDRRSLQIIYFTFIRPLLEYADVVWDNCSQYWFKLYFICINSIQEHQYMYKKLPK